jgi:hypothetical protein
LDEVGTEEEQLISQNETIPASAPLWIKIDNLSPVPTYATRTCVIESNAIYPNDFNGRQELKNIPPGTNTAEQFLNLLFTNEIVERFVAHMNSFAAT